MPRWMQLLRRHGATAPAALVVAAALVLVAAPGCMTMRLEGARELIEAHPKGFADAVNASPEAETFVRAALKKINALEQRVELY